jgi:nucleoside-diphosphate-sugar epimerase
MVDAVTAAAVADAAGVFNIFDGVISYRDFMRYYTNMTRTKLRSTPLAWMMGRAALDEFTSQAAGRFPRQNRSSLQAMVNTELPEDAQAKKAVRELGWMPRISLEEGMAIIERSNGFHKNKKNDPDPWKENEEWVEEEK